MLSFPFSSLHLSHPTNSLFGAHFFLLFVFFFFFFAFVTLRLHSALHNVAPYAYCILFYTRVSEQNIKHASFTPSSYVHPLLLPLRSAPDAAPAPGAPGADGAPAGPPPAPPNTSSNRRLQQTQAQVEEVSRTWKLEDFDVRLMKNKAADDPHPLSMTHLDCTLLGRETYKQTWCFFYHSMLCSVLCKQAVADLQ